MLISEIYCSRQGEGLLTGTPSVFVRTSGCNLRCGFCDTPYTSWEPTGTQMAIPKIMEQILAVADQSRHVVLTGGEPMLPREVESLCQEIAVAGFHITIETAGTILRSVNCDLMSISPKLSNSDPDQNRAGTWRQKHQATRMRPQIVQQLIETYPYQLKFVVDQPNDLEEILSFLRQLDAVDRSRVLLMPQGVESAELEQRAKWIEPICDQHGFTFCPRKHIQWYGNTRGT